VSSATLGGYVFHCFTHEISPYESKNGRSLIRTGIVQKDQLSRAEKTARLVDARAA